MHGTCRPWDLSEPESPELPSTSLLDLTAPVPSPSAFRSAVCTSFLQGGVVQQLKPDSLAFFTVRPRTSDQASQSLSFLIRKRGMVTAWSCPGR